MTCSAGTPKQPLFSHTVLKAASPLLLFIFCGGRHAFVSSVLFYLLDSIDRRCLSVC